MPEEVRHYQVNGKYRVQFERSATKGVIGYKVEANSEHIRFHRLNEIAINGKRPTNTKGQFIRRCNNESH